MGDDSFLLQNGGTTLKKRELNRNFLPEGWDLGIKENGSSAFPLR